MKFINMTGSVYGDLKVIALSNRKNGAEWLWQCECLRCGRIAYARGTDLRAGRRVACAVCSVAEGVEKRKKAKAHEPKVDCMAYSEGKCTALKEMLCKTKGKCNFYKPKEEGEA